MYTKRLSPGISYRCFCPGTMSILRYFLSPGPAGFSGTRHSFWVQCTGRLYRNAAIRIAGYPPVFPPASRLALVSGRGTCCNRRRFILAGSTGDLPTFPAAGHPGRRDYYLGWAAAAFAFFSSPSVNIQNLDNSISEPCV